MIINRRDKISIALLCLILPIAIFLWYSRLSKGYSIPYSGGQPLDIQLSAEPFYFQTDPQWASDRIGSSGEKIENVGCTICCVSMGLAQFGIEFKPDRLNELLKEKGGYTEKGWFIWDSVSNLTDNKVEMQVVSKVNYDDIDTAIQQGYPVVTKVYINGVIAHWVLIAGKEDFEYLIKDPLGDVKTLEKLSKYDSNIYSIRIMKPRE